MATRPVRAATLRRIVLGTLCALPGCATLGRIPESSPAAVIVDGSHFRILCHFDCGDGAEAALEAAEAAWRHTALLVGRDASASLPRPIHLYETEEEYEAIEARLTGGRFRLNRAFSVNGEQAHLSVHPNLGPEALGEFGLTSNTLRVVAHEAMHMALRTIAPRSTDFPVWLDEGLATSVELDVLLDLGLATGRWEEPVSGTRVFVLQDRIRRDRLPALATLLSGDTDDLTLSERYAFYQLFTDFLRLPAREKRLRSTLATLESIQSRRFDRALVPAILGVELDALAPVDSAFRTWLGTLEPGWMQVRRTLTVAGTDWLQVGFDNGAEAWRWPITPRPYRLAGEARTLGGNAFPTILVALQEGARLAFALEGDSVRVQRLAFAGDTRPVTLLRAPAGQDVRSMKFALEISDDAVAASIGNATFRIDAKPSGRWGLATGPAGNVVWHDVRVEPGPGPPGGQASGGLPPYSSSYR